MEQEPFINQPIDPRPDNTIPTKETDFDGISDIAALPNRKLSLGNFNDWLFSLMRPKAKTRTITKRPRSGQRGFTPPDGDPLGNARIEPRLVKSPDDFAPIAYDVQNGLLVNKKNFIEIARDQIKNQFAFTASHKLVNGLALILFLFGVFAIYSEIPTHPELVLGIVLVSLGGNVLIGNRV